MAQGNQGRGPSRVKQFLLGTVPEVYRARFRDSRMRTNLSKMRSLAIFIIAIQVLLNLIHFVKPQEAEGEDLTTFVALSLFCLLLGLVFLALSELIKRGRIQNKKLLCLLPAVLLYAYAAIQMIFFSMNVEAAGTGSNSFMIAALVVSLFYIMPPLQSILSLLFLFSTEFFIMYQLRDASSLWDSVLLTDAWANMIIIMALIIYGSCMVFDMYVRNFINRIWMEGSNHQLEHIAHTDSLTEMLNRRGFFKRVDRDWSEYAAQNKLVAVCMLDIDHFKRFNDEHGHLMGDNCLHKVGQRLKELFGQVDGGIVCRYGGEEFLAVFRAEREEEAIEITDHICQDIGRIKLSDLEGGGTLYVTISGGLAFGSGDVSCDTLIRLADDALYQAKENGRNQVCVNEASYLLRKL